MPEASPPIHGPTTPVPGATMGVPVVFVVPDPHAETGTAIVMVPPPFRLFCGHPSDVDQPRHGLWVSQRPHITPDTQAVDPERDFLLVDFGLRMISPEWQQAQTQYEMWLLNAIAEQLAKGMRLVNVYVLIQQSLQAGNAGPLPRRAPGGY